VQISCVSEWRGSCNLQCTNQLFTFKDQGDHTMKSILTGTLATFVLGAAIAAQTPPAPQTPPPAAARPQATMYKGVLKGSEASGWTIAPIDHRSGATGTAGATATAGASTPAVTYTVVTPDGSKVDLASMADRCVEISGALSPSSGAAGAGAAGSTSRSNNRTLTVTTIKAAEGCK
jgi:hypothetical protein